MEAVKRRGMAVPTQPPLTSAQHVSGRGKGVDMQPTNASPVWESIYTIKLGPSSSMEGGGHAFVEEIFV